MPRAMKLEELRDVDGRPLNLDPPMGQPGFRDFRENDVDTMSAIDAGSDSTLAA